MGKYSFKLIAVVTLVMMMFSSCTKTIVNREIYADSYIHSIFDKTGMPVYVVKHTAFSFTKLGSVSVLGALGTPVLLPNITNDGYSFYNEPDTVDYKAAIPAPESFTYNVTYNNGETTIKVDAIVAKSLLPAQQVDAVKNSTDIVLTWMQVANAEAYKVRIFSHDANSTAKTLIYESDFLVPKDVTITPSIPFSLISLSQYLTTNLSFEVSAFIFEENQDTYHAVSAATVEKYFGM
jgi:hypothetical protein